MNSIMFSSLLYCLTIRRESPCDFFGMAIRESSSRRMARPLSASSSIVARCSPLFDCMVRKPWNKGSILATVLMSCVSALSSLLPPVTREHTSKSDNVPVTQAKVLFGCFRAQMLARRMRPTKRSLSPAFPSLGCSHARICRCVLSLLSRSFFLILISKLHLVVQILVFKRPPVGNQQPVGIVPRPRHGLDIAGRHQ